ncbi:LytTR family transcriptional regulator DNA-binding domain-containing protein [Neobacillus thermocopriae]|uniref:HTH LytTR-type domain-containing protein n=1 Tax=Neobacillus thermocopriae TaxID=1215031 RepID=A0A6B3TTX7_9BACI|nr:hypothetical protein [Neobacillus thermocopriae]
MFQTRIYPYFGYYRPHKSYLIPINKIKVLQPDPFMRSYNIMEGCSEEIKVSMNKIKIYINA